MHNVLSGTAASGGLDGTSEAAIVQITVGTTRILAEVTRDAVVRPGIVAGTPVQALIKSVSLEVLTTTAPRHEDPIT